VKRIPANSFYRTEHPVHGVRVRGTFRVRENPTRYRSARNDLQWDFSILKISPRRLVVRRGARARAGRLYIRAHRAQKAFRCRTHVAFVFRITCPPVYIYTPCSFTLPRVSCLYVHARRGVERPVVITHTHTHTHTQTVAIREGGARIFIRAELMAAAPRHDRIQYTKRPT